MSGWNATQLGDQINLKRGHDLPSQSRIDGKIPIFSSSGISGYHNEKKADGPGVITGRYGTIGQVFFSATEYWPLNTALYVQDFKGNDPKFVYYFLKQLDWEKFSDKSAVPGVNRNNVHQEPVIFPLPDEQKAIATVLNSIDDKIDLLHRQNKTLEAMAETLFRQWFVEEVSDDWEGKALGDLVTITRGASPRPIVQYVKNGTVPWIKIADATGSSSFFINATREFILEEGVSKSVKVFPCDLIMSNSATCGLPYFVDIEGCIHDGWLLFKDFDLLSNYFVFFFLKCIYKELMSAADGSVQDNLNTGILKEFPVRVPPPNRLGDFDDWAGGVIAKVRSNTQQIRTLEALRDSLLPKLMSGEVRVTC